MDEEAPPHAAVEGPEEVLEPMRRPEEAAPPVTVEAAAEAAPAMPSDRERELLDRLARLQADFDNFRRRTREEGQLAASRGREQMLRELLLPLDNLDRALQHAPDEGLQLVARGLREALGRVGVAFVEPAPGEPFDARAHEAVARASREGVPPGAVAEVLERGVTLDGRVVRPARVLVGA